MCRSLPSLVHTYTGGVWGWRWVPTKARARSSSWACNATLCDATEASSCKRTKHNDAKHPSSVTLCLSTCETSPWGVSDLGTPPPCEGVALAALRRPCAWSMRSALAGHTFMAHPAACAHVRPPPCTAVPPFMARGPLREDLSEAELTVLARAPLPLSGFLLQPGR